MAIRIGWIWRFGVSLKNRVVGCREGVGMTTTVCCASERVPYIWTNLLGVFRDQKRQQGASASRES